MTLGRLLITYGFVRTIEEAERLCEQGSVRLNGDIVCNVYQEPSPGSILGTLESSYTVLVPSRHLSLEESYRQYTWR